MTSTLLKVNNLKTSYYTHLGEVKAVRGVSFSLDKGETLGIVGESGSGKSVTALSIMGLLQYPGKIINGEILFEGECLLEKSNKAMKSIRGNRIAMIFQDPMTSLNPLMKVGYQVMESMILNKRLTKVQAKEKALEMLTLVGIPSPRQRFEQYPHELSGGLRQRVMIAMALFGEPSLLIADEPTTALDVTIQAQILQLIKDLNSKLNMSLILITHDLGVVADVCNNIIVMYGGLIMETGTAKDIFNNPSHPYTIGLLKSIVRSNLDEKKRLVPIAGTPIDLLQPPKGCPFNTRCSYAMAICHAHKPPFFSTDNHHQTACWLLHEEAPKVNFKLSEGH